MTDLSIILVNWNCLAYTEQCLASIRENTSGIDYEVIVVDNDSLDAPCQSLVEKFSWIKLVLSNENLGFGRANNLGVRHSVGKNLLFLNPDTLVQGDALPRMLTALDSVPSAGAIGCRLLNPDGSLQTTCVQPFPTIMNQLLALRWLQRLLPNLALWGKRALYSTRSNLVHEVDVVSGAAILVKREVFENVGGFHPEYFMYAEEAELCFAIRRSGHKVLYTSDAQIVHFGGQSTKSCEDDFAAVTMRDSVYKFMRRNRGSAYAALYRVGLLLSAICRMIILACMFPFATIFDYPCDRPAMSRIFRKWIKIAQWTLGGETSTASITETVTNSAASFEN